MLLLIERLEVTPILKLMESGEIGVEKVQKLGAYGPFEKWAEKWTHHSQKDPLTFHVYRNKTGDLVDVKTGRNTPGLVKMLAKRGIEAQKRCKSHSVCSIGKGADGKWYGWSHRAICGFGPGDMMFNPNCGDEKTPYKKRGNVQIANDVQAKIAAKRFAADVS